MAKGSAVFLDTTILVYWFTGEEAQRELIRSIVESHDVIATGQVCIQEFRRRFLGAVAYLLRTLKKLGSGRALKSHVERYLRNQPRTERIARLIIETYFWRSASSREIHDDERLEMILEELLEGALIDIENDLVNHVETDYPCQAARQPILKTPSGFQLGKKKCTNFDPACDLREFFRQRKRSIKAVVGYLKNPDKTFPMTDELARAKDFAEALPRLQYDGSGSCPCLRHGDFIIALESARFDKFCTGNTRESAHYCPLLGQSMIVRRENPAHETVLCSASDDRQAWRTALST